MFTMAVTPRVCRALGVAIVCTALLAVVASAQAAFPGKPGQIVFSSSFAGNREIFVASADGSGRVDLTRDAHVDVTPSWSADGRRIVFASDRAGAMEIYVMGADGSGVAQVTHDGSFADHPRFTADGRTVVYESKKGGNWEIRRIGVDGGGEVNLTRNRASDRYPAVSANGRLVAFASNRGASGTHIWVMNVQGGALKQVTLRKGNQFNPTWAPAGGRLAYVSGTLAAGTNIRTVLANGKGDHPLTALHADEQVNPSWSPDGHSIAYENCLVGNTTACTLSVMPLGGSPVNISPLKAPLLDTFDTGHDGLGALLLDAGGAQTVESDGKVVVTIGAAAVQSGQFNNINAGGTRPAGSSATSTCRPTTSCWNGRRPMACQWKSTPSTPTGLWRYAKARPGGSNTRPGSPRSRPRFRRSI
jgi:hypothetical protein